MLDDFFIRALLAGFGVALVAGPLGCFIVWRRPSLILVTHYLTPHCWGWRLPFSSKSTSA